MGVCAVSVRDAVERWGRRDLARLPLSAPPPAVPLEAGGASAGQLVLSLTVLGWEGAGARRPSPAKGAAAEALLPPLRAAPGEVAVAVVQARHLSAADDIGACDAYVRVGMGGREVQSRTVDDTCDPVWAEQLRIALGGGGCGGGGGGGGDGDYDGDGGGADGALRIEVLDDDGADANMSLGSVVIGAKQLEALGSAGAEPEWHNLHGVHSGGGQLLIAVAVGAATHAGEGRLPSGAGLVKKDRRRGRAVFRERQVEVAIL